MVAQLPGVVPDGFVYLHASPETCARRMARPDCDCAALYCKVLLRQCCDSVPVVLFC